MHVDFFRRGIDIFQLILNQNSKSGLHSRKQFELKILIEFAGLYFSPTKPHFLLLPGGPVAIRHAKVGFSTLYHTFALLHKCLLGSKCIESIRVRIYFLSLKLSYEILLQMPRILIFYRSLFKIFIISSLPFPKLSIFHLSGSIS